MRSVRAIFAMFVVKAFTRGGIMIYTLGLTLVRSHTNAPYVRVLTPGKQAWTYIFLVHIKRRSSSVRNVTNVFLRNTHYKHIYNTSMKRLNVTCAVFVERVWPQRLH